MSNRYDMIVIGAGISGLAAAFQAGSAGKQVCVLEKSDRAGGCIHSEVVPDDHGPFWIELGAHTCFNSYTRLLHLLEQIELKSGLQPREKLRYRLLHDGALLSIPSQLRFFELATHAWRLFSLDKQDRSVADYYQRLVGPNNYRNLFRHAFNAVICQPADGVPADMLFRKRPRDKSVMRSFTFAHGLGDITSSLARQVELHTGMDVNAIERDQNGFSITTATTTFTCDQLVVATPAPAAARLIEHAAPELGERLQWIDEVEIESVAIIIEKAALSLEKLAGMIATDDAFYSAVSRDYVEHPHLRGFTFHFKPGLLDDNEKTERICSLLGIESSALNYIMHKTNRLPAPRAGHHALIAEIDTLLSQQPLALIGNYFNGVAIEDCLERVEQELSRLNTL